MVKTGKDVLHVVISDMHSGSNHALFLDREWNGLNGNMHIARAPQVQIRKQFITFAEQVKKARQGMQVKLIHNGDAIDGDHHDSSDVCSRNSKEQAEIHIELMAELQKRIGWQRGDEIYYTRGTQTHVNDHEEYIARELNAVPDGVFYVHDLLKLKTNNTVSWFVHHGPGAGAGANEGNALRNWLRSIYYDALKDNDEIPDVVFTGHVHSPTYAPFSWRRGGMVYKNIHGVILPSWQRKTKYAYKVAPVSKNKIGGVWQVIKADGTIGIPQFSVLDGQ